MLNAGGFLVSSLALLSIVQCASIRKIDLASFSKKWNCQEIPAEYKVRYGYGPGYERSSLGPYFYINKLATSVELFSTTGAHCSLQLNGTKDGELENYHIYQASSNLMYLLEDWYDVYDKKVLVVDMNTCTSYDLNDKVYGKRRDLLWVWHENLIHFDDGFDEVIAIENNKFFRRSYDSQGNPIDQHKPFLPEKNVEYMWPTSPKSRDSNLIVQTFDDNVHVTNLVDAKGNLIKRLLESKYLLEYKVVHHTDEFRYAHCYQNLTKMTFECLQFDEFGNEIYKSGIDYDDYYEYELVAVRNLKKKSGVVLFAVRYAQTGEMGLDVIEMASHEIREIVYPITNKPAGNALVSDFDEGSRRFSVQIQVGVTEPKKLCRKTFTLT